MDDGHLEKRRAKTLAGKRAPQFVMIGDVAERIVARLRKRAAAPDEAAAVHATTKARRPRSAE